MKIAVTLTKQEQHDLVCQKLGLDPLLTEIVVVEQHSHPALNTILTQTLRKFQYQAHEKIHAIKHFREEASRVNIVVSLYDAKWAIENPKEALFNTANYGSVQKPPPKPGDSFDGVTHTPTD